MVYILSILFITSNKNYQPLPKSGATCPHKQLNRNPWESASINISYINSLPSTEKHWSLEQILHLTTPFSYTALEAFNCTLLMRRSSPGHSE